VSPGLTLGVHDARDLVISFVPPFFVRACSSLLPLSGSPPPSFFYSMSRPTDSCVTDLNDVLTTTASSPSLSTVGSTTARFLSVGGSMVPNPSADTGLGIPDGEYDGGAKRAHLFLFDALVQKENRVCLGFVGQENLRFCIRPALIQDPSTGKRYCGIQRHLSQFEPEVDTCYPRANEIIAFCAPSFPLSLVPEDKLTMVKTTKRSILEWSQLFKTFIEDPTPFEDGGALRRIGFATTVPLKTPSKKSDDMASTLPYGTPTGIQLIEEKAGFLDDATWDAVLDMAGIPDDLMSFLKATRSFLLDYENWWGQPLLDVNLAVNTVQTDLQTLKTSFENLSLNLGTAVEIDGMYSQT